MSGDEPSRPSRKVLAALSASREGGASRFTDEAFKCTCCGLCEPTCPLQVPILEAVRALRRALFSEGLAPEAMARLRDNISRTGSMAGWGSERWGSWVPQGVKREAGHLLLAGCMVPFRMGEVGEAAVKALTSAGLDLAVMGEDERCCGLPLYNMGLDVEFQRLAEENVKRIGSRRPRRVVTLCAACYLAYAKLYGSMGLKLDAEVVHVAEALADLVDRGLVKLRRLEGKVLVLEPCHLAGSRATESLLKVLESIPGLEVAKPRRRMCCGAPGGLRALYRGVSEALAASVIDEASQLGASTIVTSCPLCAYQLSSIAERRGLRVLDLPVLVAEALG